MPPEQYAQVDVRPTLLIHLELMQLQSTNINEIVDVCCRLQKGNPACKLHG